MIVSSCVGVPTFERRRLRQHLHPRGPDRARGDRHRAWMIWDPQAALIARTRASARDCRFASGQDRTDVRRSMPRQRCWPHRQAQRASGPGGGRSDRGRRRGDQFDPAAGISPECFTAPSIDLAAKRLVVVKSTQHFQAAFESVAGAMIYCNASGSLNMDLSSLPYRHLSRRPS